MIELASAAREAPRRRSLSKHRSPCGAGLGKRICHSSSAGPLGIVVPIAALFPLLLWISARCRPIFAAAAAFIIAFTLVWMTAFGIGYLGDPAVPIEHRILGPGEHPCHLALRTRSCFAFRGAPSPRSRTLGGSDPASGSTDRRGVMAFDWNADQLVAAERQRCANFGLRSKAWIFCRRIPRTGSSQ